MLLARKLIPPAVALAELTATDLQGSGAISEKSYTFSGVSFGAADANRVVYVMVGYDRGGSGLTPDSVTIGGVSATQVGTTLTSAGNGESTLSLWKASVPSGTSGSVAIDITSAPLNKTYFGISVWRAIGLVDKTQVQDEAGGPGATLSGNVNTDSGDYILAAAHNANGTISGEVGITERFNVDVKTSEFFASYADENVSAETPRTISVTLGGTACILLVQTLESA
ncbi:hypothetical protein [Roseovarius sp.]